MIADFVLVKCSKQQIQKQQSFPTESKGESLLLFSSNTGELQHPWPGDSPKRQILLSIFPLFLSFQKTLKSL